MTMPMLAWITIALVLGLFYAIRQNRKMVRKYQKAVEDGNDALMVCELLELKIAIIRFTRDHGALPTSMDELRGGYDQGHDFINPYRGEDYVIDLTMKRINPIPPHTITFQHLVPDGPGSERCAISIIGKDGGASLSAIIFVPKAQVTT